MSRGYGSQIIRLPALTVVNSSTERSTGDAENGFLAATFVNCANSSPICWRYSAILRPSRARRAFSIRPYCAGAPISPWLTVYLSMKDSYP